MKLSEFDFSLPEDLIAQTPSAIRGEDRLMTLDKKTGDFLDMAMADLPSLIPPGALMVFNDSKVRRARVFGKKIGGHAINPTEFVFLHPAANLSNLDSSWVVLVKNARHCRVGDEYEFLDGARGVIAQDPNLHDSALRTIRFPYTIKEDWFERVGHVPLPPYIKRSDNKEDGARYQTVYAKELGSVACPTAGLHFTKDLLDALKNRGVTLSFITLHVGLGTFLPVREDDIEKHKMHTEVYTIDSTVAEAINCAKKENRPVVAVGTTALRTLEAAGKESGVVHSGTNATDIFIYPPYQFKVVDALFTNFHTPKSTLLMLVSAFAGRENILSSYKHAVEAGYRFFSYGDAMLIS